MLEKAVSDYLSWMISQGYAAATLKDHKRVLERFVSYVKRKKVPWETVFTSETLMAFKDENKSIRTSALRSLSEYLYEEKRIPSAITEPLKQLPMIYEQYLVYYKKSRQVAYLQIRRTRRVLSALNDYLKKNKIKLLSIKIEQLDAFLADYNTKYTPVVRQNNRSCLRGLLQYLYQERKINRNLAPLLVGAPIFAQSKPPKFLRPKEVQRLFSGIKLSSPQEFRTYAMAHLAYTLGLRPKEVSLIHLDDISFIKGEISIKNRKSRNPFKLPLSEDTIKAIWAYIVQARPQTTKRALFLSLKAPYDPISPAIVSTSISCLMKRVNLTSSAYWLRHTYAQNLLEAGVSIFEIKEMLGHDKIQTTSRYIHINHKLMREILFDETL